LHTFPTNILYVEASSRANQSGVPGSESEDSRCIGEAGRENCKADVYYSINHNGRLSNEILQEQYKDSASPEEVQKAKDALAAGQIAAKESSS
jgi:hypothetical protein